MIWDDLSELNEKTITIHQPGNSPISGRLFPQTPGEFPKGEVLWGRVTKRCCCCEKHRGFGGDLKPLRWRTPYLFLCFRKLRFLSPVGYTTLLPVCSKVRSISARFCKFLFEIVFKYTCRKVSKVSFTRTTWFPSYRPTMGPKVFGRKNAAFNGFFQIFHLGWCPIFFNTCISLIESNSGSHVCVCRVMIFGFLTWASSEIPIFSVEMFAMPLLGAGLFSGNPIV